MRFPFFLLLFWLGTAAFAFAHGPGATNDFGGRRVLFIGIDGCRADALRKTVEGGQAPALQALIQGGAVTWSGFTGGPADLKPPQRTMSGPGWTTIFTGVWQDKHGVLDNRFAGHHIAEWPHLARRLRDQFPKAWSASLCDWPEIHRYIVDASRQGGRDFLDFDFIATPEPGAKGRDFATRDAEVAARVIEHLRLANPDYLSVYFGQVDEVGHGEADPAGQFSPDNQPYLDAIARVDGHVAQVIAALRARPAFAEEDWLILATTDHGGRQRTHGGQSPEERTIWMIASGSTVPKGQVIEKPVPQTAIAPTVFTHLGARIAEEWGWEKTPFAIPPKAP